MQLNELPHDAAVEQRMLFDAIAAGRARFALTEITRRLRFGDEASPAMYWLAGKAACASGRPARALEYFVRALDAALLPSDGGWLLRAAFALGRLLRRHEHFDLAFPFLELTHALGGNDVLHGGAGLELAEILVQLHQYALAEQFLDRLDPSVLQQTDTARHAWLKAEVARAANRLDDAFTSFRCALECYEVLGDCAAQARCQLVLAELAESNGRCTEAHDALTAAVGLAERADTLPLLAEAYKQLSHWYEIKRDLVTATRHYQEYLARKQRIRAMQQPRVSNTKWLTQAEARLKVLASEIELWRLREEHDAGRIRMLELQEAAYHDALTGAFNRRALNERLPELMRQSRAQSDPMSLLLIDFDHFKQVNDRFSHAVGDMVLRAGVTLVREMRRSGDFLSRYGGEEFALILPGVGAANVEATADHIRQTIAAFNWEALQPGLAVTVSIGCAVLHDDDNPEILFSRADLALYLAKRNGRNRVAVDEMQKV
ncbi:diguanylate cyclase [Chitinibacteraceae bacterium HSL-7]